MGELIASLSDPAVVRLEDPAHRPGRAQVGAFVQQRRPGLLRGDVDEPLGVQHVERLRALGRCQRPGRRRPRPAVAAVPADAGDGRSSPQTRQPPRHAGRWADDRRKLFDCPVDHRSVLSLELSVPSICSTRRRVLSRSAESRRTTATTTQDASAGAEPDDRFATHAITDVAAGGAIAFLESDRPDGPRVGDVHSDRAQPSDASVLACGEQADAQGAGLGHFCNHPGPDTRIARYPVILLLLRAIEHGKRKRRIGNPVGDKAATCREAMNGLVDRGRQLQSRRPGRQLLAESLLIPFGVRARLPRIAGQSPWTGQREAPPDAKAGVWPRPARATPDPQVRRRWAPVRCRCRPLRIRC